MNTISQFNTIKKPLGKKACISASAINTYVQCPAKYLWSYIFNILGDETEYIETEEGIQFHKWCDNYYSNNPVITIELLEQSKVQNENEYVLNIINAQINYLNEQNFSNLDVKHTELKFGSKRNKFIGYIDRIDQMPDGNYCVVDYKPKDKRKYPTDVKRQLAFYATRINCLINENPKYCDMFCDGYITHGLVLGYKDASHWFFSIKNRTITAMEKQIKKMKTNTEFKCKKGLLCDWCKYNENICSVEDGSILYH